MQKAIIVIYGKDNKGIIYNVSKVLYENRINILDIKQTIVGGYFDMMAIVDINNCKDKTKVKNDLDLLSKKMNLSINFQLEETFDAMHQI